MGAYARNWLTLALLVCCCRRGETEQRQSVARSSPSAAGSAHAEPARAAGASEPAIRALLSRWLDAQNHADFAAYEPLYAKDFLGTKRVGAQAFRFNRARWLLDRKGMFSHAPKVSAGRVSILDLGQTAVLRFEQTFESGKFRDVGQKQLTLTRQGEGFSIAREEMLTSFQTAPAGVVAFPEFAFVEVHAERSFVLLESSNLPPLQPEFVDFELSASALTGDSALPENRRDLVGRELVLYGEAGELCRVKARRLVLAARAVPHEGQSEMWSGRGEEPAPPRATIARQLFELAGEEGRNLSLELEPDRRCKGALYARAADQPPLESFVSRAPSAVERRAALLAYRALPLYAKNQKAFELEGNQGDWASFEGSTPELTVFTGHAGSWLAISSAVGHGCAEYRGEGFALFRLGPDGKPTLESDGANASWFQPRVVVDADGDGVPELLGRDYRLFQRLSQRFTLALDLTPPVFACGC